MSSTLYWRPVGGGKSLPDAIKRALKKRFDLKNTTLQTHDLDYLNGLRDAGVEGAEELIAAIEKHEAITLSEVW